MICISWPDEKQNTKSRFLPPAPHSRLTQTISPPSWLSRHYRTVFTADYRHTDSGAVMHAPPVSPGAEVTSHVSTGKPLSPDHNVLVCPARVKTTLCLPGPGKLEQPGKGGHRYGNAGVKYPDRTDDENKETGHILDNGTDYSRVRYKTHRVHCSAPSWHDVMMFRLYPCQCQCVNSLVRANLTRVFTWDMKVVSSTCSFIPQLWLWHWTMWFDFGSRCYIKV